LYIRFKIKESIVKIAVLKETRAGENRVAITPQVAKSLIQMGNEVVVESGAGLGSHFSNELYTEAGASVVDRGAMKDAAMFVQINMPEASFAHALPSTFQSPFQQQLPQRYIANC